MAQFKKLGFYLLILLTGLQIVSAANLVTFSDTWTSSHSSSTDGVVWGGYSHSKSAVGYNSQADCLCWDWCDDGSNDDDVYSDWDNCYCASTAKKNSCISYSSWISNLNSEGKVFVESLSTSYSTDTGSSGDRFKCGVDLREYRDCDNSAGARGIFNHEDQDGRAYYVVYPKKYDCDGENYDTQGKYASSNWVIWDNDRSCGTYERCDTNSVHTNHDDQEITGDTTTIPDACNLRDGTTFDYSCVDDNECWSGDCGGGIHQYRYNCDSDGGANVDKEEYWLGDTCGGQGYSLNNWGDAEETTCTTIDGTGYVCDSDHDDSPVTYPSTPSSPCRKNLDQSCTTTPNCWNDDGGNWCNTISKCTDGTNGKGCGSNSDCNSLRCDSTCMAKLADGSECDESSDCINNNCMSGLCGGIIPSNCTGTVQVITEDRNGNAINGTKVYRDEILMGVTNQGGALNVNSSEPCQSQFAFEVLCPDLSAICGEQYTAFSTQNDYKSLLYDCSVCSTEKDLQLSLDDVFLNKQAGQVIANISLVNVPTTSNVNVTFKVQGTDGLIKREKSQLIEVYSSYTFKSVAESLTLSDGDFLHVYIDTTDKVAETKETNNYARVPLFQKETHAYLNINTSYPLVDDKIREFLKQYVIEETNPSSAQVQICVGKKCTDFSQRMSYTRLPGLKNTYDFENGYLKYNNAVIGQQPYIGIVGGYMDSLTGTKYIVVFGNDIDGDIAAVKKLISQREIFLTEKRLSEERTTLIDQIDPLGISVADLLRKPSNFAYYSNLKSAGFANVVDRILNNNNFEIAIQTVKTKSTTSYGQQTILRLKNVNSDFSKNYTDTITNNAKPVVMSGGIFSDLESWEQEGIFFKEDTGLARNLVNHGFDVWEIEMNGGENTECDSCPDYTYQDQVDYFWPVLLAGVMNYSGVTQVNYIGHSNGCRVALSSLNEYSDGQSNVGYGYNSVTGLYDQTLNLPNLSVDKFFGVACPATLNDITPFTRAASYNSTILLIADPLTGGVVGDEAILQLRVKGLNHVKMHDYATILATHAPSLIVDAISLISHLSHEKISLNLMDFYNDLAIDPNTYFNISNVRVNKFYLYNSRPDDFIVGYADQDRLFGASNISEENRDGESFNSLSHSGITEDSSLKNGIERRIKQ